MLYNDDMSEDNSISLESVIAFQRLPEIRERIVQAEINSEIKRIESIYPNWTTIVSELKKKGYFDNLASFKHPLCAVAYLYKSIGFYFSDYMDYYEAIKAFEEEYRIRYDKLVDFIRGNEKIINDERIGMADRLSYAKACYKLGDAYEHVGEINKAYYYIDNGLKQFMDYFTFFDIGVNDPTGEMELRRLSTALYKAKFANRLAKYFRLKEPGNTWAQINHYMIVLKSNEEYLHLYEKQHKISDDLNDFKIRINRIRLQTEVIEALYQLGILYSNTDYFYRAEQYCLHSILEAKSFLRDCDKLTARTDRHRESRKLKVMICLCKNHKKLGDLVFELEKSIYQAYQYYQSAILLAEQAQKQFSEVKRIRLITAKLYYDFEKKLGDTRYRGQLEMILKAYPYVYDLQCLKK